MPYAPAFERALRLIASGKTPESKSLRHITPEKARAMLAEASREGKRRAIGKKLKGKE